MSRNAWSTGGEDFRVVYSAIPPGKRSRATRAAHQHAGDDRGRDAASHDAGVAGGGGATTPPVAAASASPRDAGAGPPCGADDLWHDAGPGVLPGPVRSSRGAWPRAYRRALTVAFLGALLALGVLLGTLAAGQAPLPRPLSSSPSRHGVDTTRATQPGAISGVPAPATNPLATPDARFAIATLDIRCLLDSCEATQYVPAGQHVYALQAGVTCTTTSATALVGHGEQYVYCRLDQPNVFAYTFDGAQFGCVGSRFGCHNVVRVETTNGR